jgi:3-methyladenine DNA glycosylase/8-oxoguanine DNA glycosylase
MLENLFNKFGKKIKFDNKVLSTFWEPKEMAKSSEEELRSLKVGYRAKFFMKVTEQFANKVINEFALRKATKEFVKKEMQKLYGIGPASTEYLLFEDFYFLDGLEKIPPWEQKIMSKLPFNKELVPTDEILNFFQNRYRGYEKLAFHYMWEDLFWKRKHERIEWLEKEIRL